MVKFRRRQFFVKKEFQGKFILLYALMVILVSFVTAYLLNARLNETVDSLFFSSHLKVHDTSKFVYSELLQVNMIAIVLLAAGIIGLSLLVFRRLNAHFQRIEQAFDRMAQGQYNTEDLPVSHFNEISAFIGLVEEVRGACSARCERLAGIAARLRRALEDNAEPGELEALHDQLKTLLDDIRLPAREEGKG